MLCAVNHLHIKVTLLDIEKLDYIGKGNTSDKCCQSFLKLQFLLLVNCKNKHKRVILYLIRVVKSSGDNIKPDSTEYEYD